MTARPTVGAKMQVHLSRLESSDWADEAARAELVLALRKQARARGRRFCEIFDDRGVSLVMVDA